jgi:putative spermidine/putrescine transport system ATP-binding protein
MQLELKHLQEELGITILYVTHDQEEALTMSTRIAIMNNGRIEQLGTALDLYEHPANRFVADFIGETNFFRADIIRFEGDMVHVSGPCIRRIRGKAFKKLEIGEAIHLAVRPEKIMFSEAQDCGDCCYEGTVEEVIYLGDINKYYVRLSNVPEDEKEGVVVMKVQNRLGTVKHQRGDYVKIGWNEVDATIV